ncbi:MAG: hypothetical protein L0221_13945, partial [Chloroflexi bacterium]|nr:hypothetical protein [Chloroflexota bacterium]
DRVIAGPERRTRVMSEHEKLVIAYHEAGHALVSHLLPDADDVHKVSIVARGRALGLTWYLPEDRSTHTAAQLRAHMSAALGGRTAEELRFGEITTGAANDIEKCTEIARAMVTQYGMSSRLGPRKFGQESGEVFLGRDYGHQRDYSDDIASRIDDEVNALIEEADDEATALLTRHRDLLDRLAAALVEKETLEEQELAQLFEGVPPWSGDDREREDVVPMPPVEPIPVAVERQPVAAGLLHVGEPRTGIVRRLLTRGQRRVPRPGTSGFNP